jgi:cysteine synthase A
MLSRQLKIIDELEHTFANTPVIKLVVEYKKQEYTIYGKYEAVGFSGSLKDRIARYIIRDGYKTGKIKDDTIIVECSSGNTGIALTSLAKIIGNKTLIFIPEWMSEERFKILNILGADVYKISKGENGFERGIQLSKEWGKKPGYFCVSQFDNPLNLEAHYNTTAPELLNFMQSINTKPDLFVAGVGSGGVTMAFARLSKERKIGYTTHPLEPNSCPILTNLKGIKQLGNHRIEGIADDIMPPLTDLTYLDEPVGIDDGDAIIMSQDICKMGISCGISGGANLAGCIKQLHKTGGKTAITLFCDSAIKYLTTDLFKTEMPKETYISSHVKIIDANIIRS